jgi:hypothetical protein
MIAEPDIEDSTFSAVVKFFTDQNTGEYIPKFCEVGVKNWSDDDNFTFVGEKVRIELTQYLEQKSVPITIFFKDEDKFLKVNIVLTVRETNSGVTISDDAQEDGEQASSEDEQDQAKLSNLAMIRDPLAILGNNFQELKGLTREE